MHCEYSGVLDFTASWSMFLSLIQSDGLQHSSCWKWATLIHMSPLAVTSVSDKFKRIFLIETINKQVSKVIWQKAALPSIMAANELICFALWLQANNAQRLLQTGISTRWDICWAVFILLHHVVCFTVGQHMSLQKLPFQWEESVPHLILDSLGTHKFTMQMKSWLIHSSAQHNTQITLRETYIYTLHVGDTAQ